MKHIHYYKPGQWLWMQGERLRNSKTERAVFSAFFQTATHLMASLTLYPPSLITGLPQTLGTLHICLAHS
eukprot:1156846-Pelagomonas_calceolata.AAC.2